jgi:heme A synthase
MTTQDSGGRTVIARFSAPVLRPTGDSVRGLALASVIANAVLVCAGAAVRLSSSGLGCPDWPRYLSTRERQPPVAAVAIQAGPATAARNPQASEATLEIEEGMIH